MHKFFTLFSVCLLQTFSVSAQYNKLAIPDTLAGFYDAGTHVTNFPISMHESMTQFLPGNQTITAGFNDNTFLGPTLIFNKGEKVQINLLNMLNDTTTLHWHGIHLPAVMDGGPHQTIPPGTIWQPYWTVDDAASTYWYHPHLHGHTNDQVRSGLAGLIIVRDSEEAALPLPRMYGLDDVPLVITDRKFDSITNQFDTIQLYGDTVLTNGVLNAVDSLPARVVRFRILGAAQERCYNLGFSDNTTFYVIGSDGSLLNSPVPLTRYLLSPGERIEILVNFTGRTNTSLDLMAYNDSLNKTTPGGIPYNGTSLPFLNNKLGYRRFNLLHLQIGNAGSGGFTTIPTTLKTNTFWNIADTNLSRKMVFVNDTAANIPFTIDSIPFEMEHINKTIPLNNIEVWTIFNNSSSGHIFHIHDIQFHIIERKDVSGNIIAPRAAEEGWKDVVFLDSGQTLSFITKFTDFADSIKPYMYHCHMLGHEDAGMMGQFVVVDNHSSGIRDINILPESAAIVFPNPATDRLFVDLEDKNTSIYYITILDNAGRTKYMLPNPHLKEGLYIADLKQGTYFLNIIDSRGNMISRKFVKM